MGSWRGRAPIQSLSRTESRIETARHAAPSPRAQPRRAQPFRLLTRLLQAHRHARDGCVRLKGAACHGIPMRCASSRSRTRRARTFIPPSLEVSGHLDRPAGAPGGLGSSLRLHAASRCLLWSPRSDVCP